jgi:LPS O-antigen subunit length determinant protein (WzzB/FepE family)
MTADRVGVGKLAMKEPADLLVVNSNVLSRLQERLLRQKMQLDLLEQINPQSAEILPIKAEVETIEEKLSSLQESKNENSNREAETLAGLRIQLARQETHVKRLQETELPLLEIVDSAVVPIEPSNSPKTALILGLSGLVGFFGSILLAFLIDFIQKLRTQYTTNLSVNPKLTQES